MQRGRRLVIVAAVLVVVVFAMWRGWLWQREYSLSKRTIELLSTLENGTSPAFKSAPTTATEESSFRLDRAGAIAVRGRLRRGPWHIDGVLVHGDSAWVLVHLAFPQGEYYSPDAIAPVVWAHDRSGGWELSTCSDDLFQTEETTVPPR